MSVNVSIAGVSFTIPNTGEVSWGDQVTSWIQKVSNSTLQTSGGSFSLTAEADFGANYGLKALYLKSETANPASSGLLRLANADGIAIRNAGNTADLLLKASATGDGFLAYNGVDLVGLSLTQTLTNKTLSLSSNTISSTSGKVAQFNASTGALEASAVTTATLGYLDATSSIQTQLNAKAPLANPTFTGVSAFAAGTAAAPAVTLGDSTTGFFRPALNQLGGTIAGAQMWQLDSGGLAVGNPTRVSTAALQVQVGPNHWQNDGIIIDGVGASSLRRWYITVDNSNYLYFGNQGSSETGFQFQPGGNIGIGTTPITRLTAGADDANIDSPAVANTRAAVSITNTTSTVNNYSALFFKGVGAIDAGIVSRHEVHTGGSETSHLEIWTKRSGTVYDAMRVYESVALPQIATPSNPPSGFYKVYFKSDTKPYYLTSGGSEVQISTGGGAISTVTKTSAYTITITDDVILADASGGGFTLTLPAVATATKKPYLIKKIDSSANQVTVQGNASETIDGDNTQILTMQYGAIEVVPNGSAWYIF